MGGIRRRLVELELSSGKRCCLLRCKGAPPSYASIISNEVQLGVLRMDSSYNLLQVRLLLLLRIHRWLAQKSLRNAIPTAHPHTGFMARAALRLSICIPRRTKLYQTEARNAEELYMLIAAQRNTLRYDNVWQEGGWSSLAVKF